MTSIYNVKDYGAFGDGTSHPLSSQFSTLSAAQAVYPTALALTDEIDGLVIQNAINKKISFYVPAGTYLTTYELVWATGARCYGDGNWSGVGAADEYTGTTVIKYAGAGGTNSCVIRMSTQPVGTNTSVALQNIGLTKVTIDGGLLAEFGLYTVRAWSNNQLDYITVTGTTKHGFYAALCWNGSPTSWVAYKNIGCGITLGANIWSPAWTSTSVDQSTCTSFFANYSGYSYGTGTQAIAQNQFDVTSHYDREYGVGVFGSRALVLINAQALNCGGVGAYVSTVDWPVTFVGGYFELCGNSSAGDGHEWCIWINGSSTGATWAIKFDGVHIGQMGYIRLMGTQPSRPEMGVIFSRIPGIDTINADWGNYRLEDCDRGVTYANVLPNGFRSQTNSFRDLDIVGAATFNGASSPFATLEMEGVISAVTRPSTGTFHVTLSPAFASAQYAVFASGLDGYTASIANITSSSFDVLSRNSSGTLSNANRISVVLTSYF